MSLQTSNPNDDTVRREGILSARQLGALEDVGSVQHFTCIKFKKKEEQIIETQDKPQCLVATKATLTLTVPGCNRVVYRGFIASAI